MNNPPLQLKSRPSDTLPKRAPNLFPGEPGNQLRLYRKITFPVYEFGSSRTSTPARGREPDRIALLWTARRLHLFDAAAWLASSGTP
jgi:hypothetical protein